VIRRIGSTPETWLFLAAGSLCLLLAQLDAFAGHSRALAVVLVVAVALTGLPHGALDPWVAWRAGLWRTRRGFATFHVAYIAIAVVVVLVWQVAPGPSLAAFLAISAWHFSGDWRDALNGWMRAPVGAALLSLPALAAPAEVSAIFTMLSGPEGGVLAGWLAIAAPWLAVAAAASALVALKRSTVAAVEIVVVAALAVLLPPLVFFLVYFCALHSPRHLRLAAQSADARRVRRMATVAAAYTVLTVIAAAIAWPWITTGFVATATPDAPLLRLLFVGLAALTLPHMIVVLLSERRGPSLP